MNCNIKSVGDACVGCALCSHVCHSNAIAMQPDNQGFLYPKIQLDACINCGICLKACPADNVLLNRRVQEKVYAAQCADIEQRKLSTSGGAFYVLAESILSQDGVVYGAAFNLSMEVVHVRCDSQESLCALRESKYVQSNMDGIYLNIEDDLNKCKPVLFSGTPCQCAAVKSYIRSSSYFEYLYLCEIICHGVSSPLIWRDMVVFIEKHARKQMSGFSWRSKNIGWRGLHEEARFSDGYTILAQFLNKHSMLLYGESLLLRESCTNCLFNGTDRVADITIGDFWGVEECLPDFIDDNTGISAIICNTVKGEKLVSIANKRMNYQECTYDDCARKQPHLRGISAKHGVKREQFWYDYHHAGFERVIRKYGRYGFWYIVRGKIGFLFRSIRK